MIFDTSGVVTQSAARALRAFDLANEGNASKPTRLRRCVGGSQPPTPNEIAAWQPEGVQLDGLYQIYPNDGSNPADKRPIEPAGAEGKGERDGAELRSWALAFGLDTTQTISLDCEGNATAAEWFTYADDALTQLDDLAPTPEVYSGPGCSLTTAQKDELSRRHPRVTWWSSGAWGDNPPTAGYAIRQTRDNVAIGPQAFDLNEEASSVATAPENAPTTQPAADASPRRIPLPDGWERVPATEATEAECREWAARFFRTLAGLSTDEPTREAYNAIVAPDDIEGRDSPLQRAMDLTWSCAETTDGEDRFLLDDAPADVKAKILFYWRAYRVGNAMVDEENAAMALGAFHYARGLDTPRGVCPKKADHVIINAATMAHTYSITSDPDDAGCVATVEGGNQIAGHMAIVAGERLHLPNGTVTDRTYTRRDVLWAWVDVVAEMRAAGVTIGRPKAAPTAQEIAAGALAIEEILNPPARLPTILPPGVTSPLAGPGEE